MTKQIPLPAPLWVGRCIVNTEVASTKYQRYCSAGAPIKGQYHPGYAGVRFITPSATDENGYTPSSDVYMYLTDVQVQELAAYFSSLARKITGVEQ